MKKIFFIFSLSLTSIVFSQTAEQSILLQNERLNLAGQELITFHKEYSAGVKFTMAATVFAGLGGVVLATSQYDRGQYKAGVSIITIGGVMALVGTSKMVKSNRHLKNAGIILTGNSVGVKIKID